MRIEFTLFRRGGGRRDVVVTGHPEATWERVLENIARPGETVYRSGRTVDPRSTLSSGVIVSGDVASTGTPMDEAPQWPLDSLCLAVVGGQCAGQLIPVRVGTHIIGRAGDADLTIDDPTVSSRHAKLEVLGSGEVQITDLTSRNGTFAHGARLQGNRRATAAPGERWALGQAVLTVLAPATPDGSVEIGHDGTRFFNRVLRYESAPERTQVTLPDETSDRESGSIWPQVAGSLAMLVAGVGTALAFGNLLFAGLGTIGPVVLMSTTLAVHRRNRAREKRHRQDLTEQRSHARALIASAIRDEDTRVWGATLDPARAALAAIGPTSDLWSVDAKHPRALDIRVGSHDRRAEVDIQERGARSVEAPTLVAAPVTVDLRAVPVLGLAGPRAEVRGVARAIVHQLAATRSPEDLCIYHLAADEDQAEWSWLRWLPHTRSALDGVHTVSPSSAAVAERLDELTSLLAQRANARTFASIENVLLPEVLVVLDGAGRLRNRSAVVKVLQEGAAAGCIVLALDDHAARLPAECSGRVIVDGSRSILEVNGRAPVPDVTLDHVSVLVAERSARAMAPLQPLGGRDESSLPRSVRFVDLANLRPARAAQILARWDAGPEGSADLGIDENGHTCTVNLVHDGPHALVAGTSGSGKSELLRTLVAGLALSASPADLALLLVDFKGGGAFGKLADLPHVVGYADDLSIGGVLATRLLDSLRAELEYRKSRFKEAGNVEGLVEYRRARTGQAARHLPPLARLVIVVDEFAELKEAQPEFVDGLVNVARVGRSLGVHLVLATQQPAGVVTPQIRDNANLRICLRVLDPGTSSDLVGTPLAGTFSNRDKGRAVVVSGDAPPVVFQTAYISAPASTVTTDAPPPPQVDLLPWAACGVVPAVPRAEAGPGVDTDLSELVAVLRDCAESRDLAPSRRPWQHPLPDTIVLSEVSTPATSRSAVPFGIEDHPRKQRHDALRFSVGGGNLGIAGGRASGRSTALRTLATALATAYTADDLHLYVIDQSPASALRPLARLPHCGVVATRSDRYVAERLMVRLRESLASRSAVLGRAGCANLRELRETTAEAPPWVVVMVDGWDVLASGNDNDALRGAILGLAEEGPPLGVQLVVAGGKALATSRLRTALQDLLVLRFDQRDDLHDFGVPARAVPAEQPPGRAYRPGSPDAVQIAVLDAAPDSDRQNEALRAVAGSLAPPTRTAPWRIRPLPTSITLGEALNGFRGACLPPRGFVPAVGGDEVVGRVVDLDTLRTPFVVAGPPGSGRTNTLAVIAAQLHARGVPLICWRVTSHDSSRFPAGTLVDALPPGPLEPGTVVLVDDAHRLDAYDDSMTALLDATGTALILAGDAGGLTGFAGWKARLKAGATGLLLSPQLGEGEVIGTTISYEQAFSAGPGRAYLGTRSMLELVQVPLLDHARLPSADSASPHPTYERNSR